MLLFSKFIYDEDDGRQIFIKYLLKKIDELQSDKVESHKFSFDMYDLQIDFKKKEVIIESILDKEEYLRLSLDNFFFELFNYYEK
jgi:hypothetical protein